MHQRTVNLTRALQKRLCGMDDRYRQGCARGTGTGTNTASKLHSDCGLCDADKERVVRRYQR